ncbi:prostaglandin F2 receptor negative regulator-like [Scleropages formosus]|uniref:prostaglandin F2 receptor negative regulator-like n=1 Tax=Scleropages formosus TaxID=113540 RepID=UPI0010FAA645|nr:prostaglandin F2 receptor negative regulator-like [Scleropages formosus]XP_018595363.2 prostaglandin F2 receptor negative regulator-like [Scleropages formosus]
MTSSKPGFFSTFFSSCSLVFLLAALGGQGRLVTIPRGPLIRVEGQSVSIRCNVSDYEGPLEQDFEWKLVQGSVSYDLVSTMDPQFTDTSFLDRVTSGDLSLTRLSDSSAELRIGTVRTTDGGTYVCSTPSTDVSVSGNYDADVELKVIKDSLQVAPVPSPALVPEGGPLELRCNVTRVMTENTYLSVTWSVGRGTSPSKDILTVGPDGDVEVGEFYTQRYSDGGLLLKLRGGGAFGLLLTEAFPSDRGEYSCTAREWVPEGGGVWQSILEKRVELGQVDITPVAASLLVSLEDNTTLDVGETLRLTCSVAGDHQVALGLEVTWSVSPTPGLNGSGAPRVLGDVNRDGVVSNRSGQVELSQAGGGVFPLAVHHVDRSDSGSYSCAVRAWVRQSNGRWYQAAEKKSGPVQVQVTMTEPNFTVTLSDLVTPRFSGDPAELACRVTGAPLLQDGRLGVTWLHGTGSDPVRTARPVAALDERGELVVWDDYRPRVESGLISLSRVKSLTFRLRFLHMWESDQGAFLCAVSTWTRSRDGGWVRSQEVRSNNLTVHWEVKKPRLGVVAYRLREASSAGATFEMSCRVIAENLQEPSYSVHVQMEQSVRSKTRRIVSLGPDLVVQPEDGGDQERRDSAVLEKSGPAEFRFRLYGVQVSDRGFYSCAVTAWTRDASRNWTKAVSSESNKVQIAFVHTGPTFNISIHADTTSIYPGETTKMDCILAVSGSTPNAGDIFYEVQWYQNHFRVDGGAALLASMDRWGVVKKSPRNSSSDCSLERVSSQVFRLSIHNTQDTDAGEYRCRAAPWMRSSAGTWTRGQDLSSTTVFLTVRFALWDSMKMPLLYGAGAALIVGLFSLLVGFACAHCWCRKVALVPRRSRNHLMVQDME